jgi:ribonuclease BN (tRNA processing enzyme)
VRLTVLGCSGSVPGPDSPSSSYLVQHDGFSLVLDMGSGAFGALQRHIAPQDVDAIVLSHLHPDHCIDIAAYEVALLHGPPHRRSAPLPIFAPEGARDRLAAGARADTRMAPNPREMSVFSFETIGASSPSELGANPPDRDVGPFRLTFARVAHPVPTFAVRVAVPAGPSLVYSGDTGQSDALVALAAGTDLLLCESAFVTGGPVVAGMHLTGRQAGEHAARAEARQLVITHVPPWYSVPGAVAEASQTFSGPIKGAVGGAVYQL